MSATLITFGTAPTISEVFQRPCSRVILLYDGKIAADGSAEQILGDKKLLEIHRMELPFRFQQAALLKSAGHKAWQNAIIRSRVGTV